MIGEESSIRDMYNDYVDIARNFVWQLVHHRALKAAVTDFKPCFWIIAANDCFDMAVLNWCKLFGSDSEDMHWKKIFAYKDGFRRFLFSQSRLNEREWAGYHEELTEYRNKWIGHFDGEFRPARHPDLQPALDSVIAFYQYLLSKLGYYRIENYLSKSLAEYAEALYSQALQFIKTAYRPTMDMEYKFNMRGWYP